MSLLVSPKLKLAVTHSRFDSRLYVTHASAIRNVDFIIDVYVWFCRIEPPDVVTDSFGVSQPVLSWGSDATWNGWVHRCKGLLERRLDGRFWMTPDRHWGVRVQGTNGYYLPSLSCGLRVHPVSRSDRHHLQLNCYRVPHSFCPTTASAVQNNAIYRSYMSESASGGGYGRIVNTDAWLCRTHDTEPHYQEVAVHEFLHFLGLDHVAANTPQCPPPNFNPEPCYGGTLLQRGDVEGWGNRIERWHSRPWMTRLQQHVKRSVQWSVSMSRPAPVYRQQSASEPLFDLTG